MKSAPHLNNGEGSQRGTNTPRLCTVERCVNEYGINAILGEAEKIIGTCTHVIDFMHEPVKAIAHACTGTDSSFLLMCLILVQALLPFLCRRDGCVKYLGEFCRTGDLCSLLYSYLSRAFIIRYCRVISLDEKMPRRMRRWSS